MKQKLSKREFTLGSWLTLGHPAIPEILGRLGYEFLVVDNEHSMMSLETIQNMLLSTQSTGAKALVRLSHNHDSEIRKLLDAGADGLICPMINTKRDAQRFIDAVKYPPMGKRSYGLTRAQGYGANSTQYFAEANQQTIAIAQIEHIEAVRTIEEILSVSGIDGVLTGPYDLSGSLNIPGQLDHPEVRTAETKVIAACKNRGISCGAHLVHPTRESIQAKLDLGYTFLAVGTDFIFISEQAKLAKTLAEELKR